MINIRKFKTSDKQEFCALATMFYNSDAVCHSIPTVNLEKTFDLCIAKSPFCTGFALEYNGSMAGFALLSFTHSTEAGGMVVLLEDLFVLPEFRGKGIVSEFFKMLESTYNDSVKRYRLEITKSNKSAKDIYAHYGYEVLDYTCMCKDL